MVDVARRGREASARFGRMVRDSFARLLDQRTPFGRLALVQVVMTAGDTLVTVSLAGSLFFSISPDAAKEKVILYLVLTMTPFAVIAPLLGPVIDRSRGARRATVVFSAATRAVMSLFMAGALKSLLLFPDAFAMLVLSKVYLVTKGSLVPLLLGGDPGTSPHPAEAPDGGATTGAAAPGVGTEDRPGDVSDSPDKERLATANAQLGLLSSLTAFAAALPAIAVLKLLGGSWVLRLDMVVFVMGTILALRLPIPRRARPTPAPSVAGDTTSAAGQATADWQRSGPLGAYGPSATGHPEVTFALSAMSILKFVVGFLTFLLAFDLRKAHATLWYGPILGLSIAGGVAGVLLVPRLRRFLAEQQVLMLAIWLVALAAVLTAVVGGVVIQTILAFVIGMSGGAGKPAFDALVQRYVPTAAQGRAFARFETRLQLVWVLGALIPVVASLPLGAGDIVIAAVSAVGGLSYVTGRRAVRHLRAGAR
jgi:hypothetical protein